MKRLILMLFILAISTPLFAKEEIIFTGIPETKISEGGISRVSEILTKEKAIDSKCTVTKIDEKYYWTTRQNIELIPIDSGVYTTFLAINGAGYIRIVKPEMKGMIKEMGSILKDTEEKFDYVEHLLLGLKAVTYYGKSK